MYLDSLANQNATRDSCKKAIGAVLFMHLALYLIISTTTE